MTRAFDTLRGRVYLAPLVPVPNRPVDPGGPSHLQSVRTPPCDTD